MKILYACTNTSSAKIQCERFLEAVKHKNYIIKIAAYKEYLPNNNADWTLNCLLNIFEPSKINLISNDNLEIYYNQVKNFKPDLVISDLEIFSTHIGHILNIPIWQCSSALINDAMSVKKRQEIKLLVKYKTYYSKQPNDADRHKYMLNVSNKRLIYSHFLDLENVPNIDSKFEWVRPYHKVGEKSDINNLVCIIPQNNKKILDLLSKYNNSICFTNQYKEQYNNILLKDLNNIEEYYNNLYNCSLSIIEGQLSLFADAFYNNKYCLSILNFNNPECVMSSVYSEYFGLSTTIFDSGANIEKFLNKKITINYKQDAMFLHQKIEEVYG